MAKTEAPTRDELVAELRIATAAAAVCKPSPRWDALHAHIDELLDEIVGA